MFAKCALKLIPVPVLFGIFLYFGIVSLSGTQLFERVKLVFVPCKHLPNLPYAKGVSTRQFYVFFIKIIYLNDLFEGADFQTKHIHFYTNYRRGSFVGVQINRTRFVYISGRSCVTGRLEETFFHKIFYSQRA